ncbi:MAG: hypothetical protein ACREGI_02845, partial [Candidatus Levyibacteriota bacterium]
LYRSSMPDIFTSPENNAGRDRRFRDEAADAPLQEIKQTDSKAESPDKTIRKKLLTKETISAILTNRSTNQMHIFSSFCENPERVSFQTQEEGEKIVVFLRKSFITNISWIFLTVIFSLVPIAVIQILQMSNTHLSLLPLNFLIIILLFYYLVVLTLAFIHFITWYFTIDMVTDQKIVDVNFADLVYKNIAETKLNLVQDVSFTQTGVIKTVFDYGDVLIQTAGTVDNFDMYSVPRPERVVEIVEALIGKRGGIGLGV